MNELKKYLTINSIFSAITGLAMLIFYAHLNKFFNLNNDYVFPLIGSNLLIFSIFVWYVSNKQLTNKLLVSIITIFDWLWVFGSFTIVLFNLYDLSKNGKVITIIVAVWIAFLAYNQFKNNR